jgi:hypothetical protein
MSGKIVNNFFRPLEAFLSDLLTSCIFQRRDLSFCMMLRRALLQNISVFDHRVAL